MRIEGGPAEASLRGGEGEIVLHGEPGRRVVTLGDGWGPADPAADGVAFSLEGGIVYSDYSGDVPAVIRLLQRAGM